MFTTLRRPAKLTVIAPLGALALLLAGCKFPELPSIDGDAASDGGVEIDADLSLPQRLTVSISGNGTVASDPAGIDCQPTCSHDFDPLTSVSLTPTAAATAIFAGWSGDCAGSDPCMLTMDGPRAATATFLDRGSVRWVKHISFPGDEIEFKIAVDGQGNVVAAGTIDDGADGWDLFVVKYAPTSGEVLWMRHLATPGPNGELVGDVAADADGNVYLATKLQGDGSAAMYDDQSAIGDVFGNIVVLRLRASDGVVQWAKRWGGSAVDYPAAVAVSGNDLYVAGYTSSNPAQFDGQTIQASTNNGFVVRADATTGLAARVTLVAGNADFAAIAVSGGRVAVAGTVQNATTVGGGCSVSPVGSGNDAYIAELTGPNLACVWARAYGDSAAGSDARIDGLSALPGGDWAIAGSFEGQLSGFENNGFTSRGGLDIFTARLSPEGQHRWVFRYGDTGGESARSIAASADGGLVLAGEFGTSLVLGSFTIEGTANVFVTRLSAAQPPTHEWAVSLGGNDGDRTPRVAVHTDGSTYVLANFSGQTQVGSTPLSSLGDDHWLAAIVR